MPRAHPDLFLEHSLRPLALPRNRHVPTFIALLRGINVGGRNRISMEALRSLCDGLGWTGVQTYIQSGNLVFQADATAPALEADLEQAVELDSGLSIPVLVRDAAHWAAYLEANPFPAASGTEPNLVMLALAKQPPQGSAVDELRRRAGRGERVARTGDALWIHYAEGVGRSKLSPALLDRLAGSPVTMRNWRTVLGLQQRARDRVQPAPDHPVSPPATPDRGRGCGS